MRGTPAVFALTLGGAAVAERIGEGLAAHLHLPAGLRAGVTPAERFDRVGPALRDAFRSGTPLVCVMSAGVVIRSLAESLGDKRTDPPVVVLDEKGRYVVPLLGGHLGGANELTRRVAEVLGAEPVLTTSSDVQGLLGPDLLAERLDAEVLEPERLTEAASALVNGFGVDVIFDPEEFGGALSFLAREENDSSLGLGGLPGYRVRPPTAADDAERSPVSILVSLAAGPALPEALEASVRFVPRWVRAGVGCRRGAAAEDVMAVLAAALEDAGLHPASLGGLASVEAKADEEGVLETARRFDVPVRFADAAALADIVAREDLEASPFVRKQVGVGAVAEPAALWAAGEGGRLVSGKRADRGVTVALAVADGSRMAGSSA